MNIVMLFAVKQDKRMNVFKKTGLTVASLILTYNTYKLLVIFYTIPPMKFSVFASIICAFAINIMITGVFAFLGFAFPTQTILPKAYYRIRNPSTLNFWYKYLGVDFFKVLLLLTFYRRDDNKKYFNGTKSGILLFDYHTKQSEFGHLIAFLCVFLVGILILYKGHFYTFLWLIAINIVLNFYPIILQRKHRIRIERLIDDASPKRH